MAELEYAADKLQQGYTLSAAFPAAWSAPASTNAAAAIGVSDGDTVAFAVPAVICAAVQLQCESGAA